MPFGAFTAFSSTATSAVSALAFAMMPPLSGL
jgi:hypothetical protein